MNAYQRKLADYKATNNLTDEDLARAANCSKSTIAYMRKNGSSPTVIAFLDTLPDPPGDPTPTGKSVAGVSETEAAEIAHPVALTPPRPRPPPRALALALTGGNELGGPSAEGPREGPLPLPSLPPRTHHGGGRAGYLYVMFTPNAPDRVKVGLTRNEPESRLANFRTAAPEMKLVHYVYVNGDVAGAEKYAHELILRTQQHTSTTSDTGPRVRVDNLVSDPIDKASAARKSIAAADKKKKRVLEHFYVSATCAYKMCLYAAYHFSKADDE